MSKFNAKLNKYYFDIDALYFKNRFIYIYIYYKKM